MNNWAHVPFIIRVVLCFWLAIPMSILLIVFWVFGRSELVTAPWKRWLDVIWPDIP